MSNTADIGQPPPEARCFRLHRYYLRTGIVCAVFFAAFGIGSTLSALWNIDGSFPRPKLYALIFGGFWSGFTLLALWLIVAYFRERLFVGETAIVQHGIFHSKTLEFGKVLEIRWRSWPAGGSAVVRTHSERVTIYFGNFTRDEREELIRVLQATFPMEIQENYSRFEDVCRKMHERERNPAAELAVVTPTQTLIASGVVFVGALWPLLTLRLGRPTSWFGEFLFLCCALLSMLAAPSMCLLTLIDISKRKFDARLLLAFALSLAGVAAFSTFIYLWIHQYDGAG